MRQFNIRVSEEDRKRWRRVCGSEPVGTWLKRLAAEACQRRELIDLAPGAIDLDWKIPAKVRKGMDAQVKRIRQNLKLLDDTGFTYAPTTPKLPRKGGKRK